MRCSNRAICAMRELRRPVRQRSYRAGLKYLMMVLDVFFPIVSFRFLWYYHGMIGFFLKKNFFDGWDNFLPLALFNSAVILIVFLFFGLAYAVSAAPALPELILFVCLIVIGVLLLAVSHLMSRIADYKSVSLKDIGQDARGSMALYLPYSKRFVGLLWKFPFPTIFHFKIFSVFFSVLPLCGFLRLYSCRFYGSFRYGVGWNRIFANALKSALLFFLIIPVLRFLCCSTVLFS